MLKLTCAGLRCMGGGGQGANEDFRLREHHLKGPGVQVNHTFKEIEGRAVCFVHRELEIQG